MNALIDRLQHQTDDLDQAGLDPAAHLATVVRRGRRYRAVTATLGALGATVVVAGSAVALPHVVGLLEGPVQPTVASTPEEVEVPAPAVDPAPEDPADPVEDAAPPAVVAPEDRAADPAEDAAAIDAVPPTLEVLDPADGATVTSAKVTFTGTTEPGARVVVGDYEATVDDEGRWSILLIAAEGGNEVTFRATDVAGNTTSRTLNVTYRAPVQEKAGDEVAAPGGTAAVEEPTGKPKQAEQPPAAATLTAAQQSSVLSSAPHRNRYWGTAAPGAKVAVLSDHGVGYVYADGAGQWELWVDFDPPGGEVTFPVTVKLYHQPEVTRSFQLTTVAEEVAAFTATQQSSTVRVGAPTNGYSGTGEPGHEVLLWTEQHGQTVTVIGAGGTWSGSLTYADVTVGDVFAVKALDLTTGAKHFFEVRITE